MGKRNAHSGFLFCSHCNKINNSFQIESMSKNKCNEKQRQKKMILIRF